MNVKTITLDIIPIIIFVLGTAFVYFKKHKKRKGRNE